MKKRIISLILAFSIVFPLIPASPALAETILTERVQGANRYETAVETSREAFDDAETLS